MFNAACRSPAHASGGPGKCNQYARGASADPIIMIPRASTVEFQGRVARWSSPGQFTPAALMASLVLLAAVVAPWARATELPGGGQQQEYFVRQNADEVLLVRIDGREAQFDAVITTIAGEVLAASGVPGSRVAPLFQYVGSTIDDRQLDIRVTAPFDTNRTRFDLGLSRLTIRDDRSARLARAYQLLAFGLEPPPADTAANWSIKVGSLNDARAQFEDFGMESLQSWAAYFAARLTLTGVGDNASALRLAEALIASPGARRQPEVRLAGLRLRAEALEALRGAGELPTGSGPDPIQAAALETAELAASLGLLFERADALFLAGRDLAARGRNDEALQRLEEALDIADAIESADLATAVRERLVGIHGEQGNVAATSEVLQAIESQLAEDGANDELAQNLLAQGRILNRTYRFERARQVLEQALAFEHNSATRDQVRLALAEAAWALGDLDTAWAQARAAVINPESGSYRRPTPVLDVAAGLDILAGVARARGQREAMRALRREQARLSTAEADRIRWAWARAQDDLIPGGDAQAAAPYLREVRDARGDGAAPSLRALARLWLCALDLECPGGTLEEARSVLRDGGVPRYQVEGDWLTARVLRRNGATDRAADALEQVVRTLAFLRYSIPGVLADAYWRHVDSIADDLLATRRATRRDDRLLMDLARLRWLRAAGAPQGLPFDARAAGLDTDEFRALLAQAEAQGAQAGGAERQSLTRDIQRRMLEGRERFDEVTAFMDAAGLEQWLAALEPGEAVLDYDRSGGRPLALLGTREGVRRIALGRDAFPASWETELERLPTLAAPEFERSLQTWADRLLTPFASELPPRIYLASGDALAYLPFEAMPLPGGARLGDSRSLLRLASFPARPGPGARLAAVSVTSTFVAGSPVDYRSGYLARLETTAELRAVMDRFLGPGLQVIQGSALLPDEFTTDAFQDAQLVHLAMPARIDTRSPGASSLELSEPFGGTGRARLNDADLGALSVDAALVVLSQAALATPVAVDAGRPPLVVSTLAAGAGAVLASAWSGTDEATAQFFGIFYDALNRGASLDEALQTARQNTPGGADGWPRLQLWIE